MKASAPSSCTSTAVTSASLKAAIPPYWTTCPGLPWPSMPINLTAPVQECKSCYQTNSGSACTAARPEQAHLKPVNGSAHVVGSLLRKAGQADVAQAVPFMLHGCAEHGAQVKPLPLQHHLHTYLGLSNSAASAYVMGSSCKSPAVDDAAVQVAVISKGC